MSIDAVVGRIDQIIAMEQDLVNPVAAQSAAAAGTSYALPDASSTGTGSTSFADALANAQTNLATGTTSQASPGATTGGAGLAAPGIAIPQVQAMVKEADSLLGKPYVYGGGHGSWGPSSGYDCSGFVSAVLHAGGYLSEPVDTTSLPSQAGIESGPGQYVTIYDRAQPGENGHVIIEIDGQFYESGGEAGSWGGGGGVEKIRQPSAAYLATFPNVLHPSGL